MVSRLAHLIAFFPCRTLFAPGDRFDAIPFQRIDRDGVVGQVVATGQQACRGGNQNSDAPH